jgi:Family of unknown function (DUF6807)
VLPVEVCAPLPGGLEDGSDWALVRRDAPGDAPIACQRCRVGPWSEGGERLCFMARPDQGRTAYGFRRARKAETAVAVETAPTGGRRVVEGERAVLVYNAGMMLPAGVPENWRRSSYVHPLYGLDGETLSDDFAKDHRHHRGLFWAWPKVGLEGNVYDLWAISGVATRFEEGLGEEPGPVCAIFGVRNGWYVGDRRIMAETAWFRVWRSGEVGRAIDVSLQWEAVGQPVTLRGAEGKGYGGLSLRFAPRAGTVITTSAGRQSKDSDRQPSPWADLSARFAGRADRSGIAIFIDADNPGFPNGWCLRDYGFLGVEWPALDTVTLEPGKPVRLQYRVWVHRGDAEDGRAADAYANYAQPPVVRVSLKGGEP